MPMIDGSIQYGLAFSDVNCLFSADTCFNPSPFITKPGKYLYLFLHVFTIFSGMDQHHMIGPIQKSNHGYDRLLSLELYSYILSYIVELYPALNHH